MTLLARGWHWLADDPHHRLGLRILQGAIGAALLFRVFTELPFAAYFWGPTGLGWGSTQRILGPTLGGLVDRVFASEIGALAVVLALGLGALGLVAGYRTDVATALALVALCLLEARLPEPGDRGDTITRLVLLYLLFTIPAGVRATRGSLAVWLHNVAVLAIALQLGVLYASSGFWKATGDQWQHGTAIYYVSQYESLALASLRDVFKQPLATTAATYASLLYEALFPLAIISPLRLPWLAFGILFHLGIAVFLGLITFSVVMIGLLLFLIPDDDYARARAWLRRHGRIRQASSYGEPLAPESLAPPGQVRPGPDG